MDNNYNYNLPNTDETVNNNQYNYPPAYNMPQQPIEQDKVNVGFCILAWFIPLFALIYFCTKKQEKPKGAKAVGIVGLVSFILNLIFVIALYAFTGSMLIKTLDIADKVSDNSIVEDYQNNEGDVKDTVDNFIASKSSYENNLVSFNGNEMKLPIKFSEFKEITGYDFTDENDGKHLYEPSETTLTSLGNNNYRIWVTLRNTNKNNQYAEECYVTEISISDISFDSDKRFIFINDLRLGTNITKEELVEMFGNTSDELQWTSDVFKYKFEDENTNNFIEISLCDNNTISEIYLSCNDMN